MRQSITLQEGIEELKNSRYIFILSYGKVYVLNYCRIERSFQNSIYITPDIYNIASWKVIKFIVLYIRYIYQQSI